MVAVRKAALLASCLSVCIVFVLIVKEEPYVDEVSILQTHTPFSRNMLAQQNVLSSKSAQKLKRSAVQGPDTNRDILLMKEVQQALTENEMEKKLNKLLQENAKLSKQNKKLEQMVEEKGPPFYDNESKLDDEETKAKIATGDNIPAPTVMAPPPPPPADFNGANAVLANPPGDFRFEPAVGTSDLDISGKEERGSILLEKKLRVRRKGQWHKPGTYFHVRGRAGHHIDCTLRGFRVLSGEFKDATVTTGERRNGADAARGMDAAGGGCVLRLSLTHGRSWWGCGRAALVRRGHPPGPAGTGAKRHAAQRVRRTQGRTQGGAWADGGAHAVSEGTGKCVMSDRVDGWGGLCCGADAVRAARDPMRVAANVVRSLKQPRCAWREACARSGPARAPPRQVLARPGRERERERQGRERERWGRGRGAGGVCPAGWGGGGEEGGGGLQAAGSRLAHPLPCKKQVSPAA
jgi:hypothetical protein